MPPVHHVMFFNTQKEDIIILKFAFWGPQNTDFLLMNTPKHIKSD